jgi:glycosyl transferase family 25
MTEFISSSKSIECNKPDLTDLVEAQSAPEMILSEQSIEKIKNYIEHIFYINLEKRTDRRVHIENVLKNYDLLDISERYVAIETAHSGIIGCSQSHLNVLKLAKERGYKNVLILEDDFEFIVPKEELEPKIKYLFENYPDFDVCMLSHIIQNSCEINDIHFPNQNLSINNHLRKVLDGQTASGYLVNTPFLDKLIELYNWSCPLLKSTNHHWLYANDMVWKSLQPDNKWYYYSPPLGKQIDGYSDNKECFASY